MFWNVTSAQDDISVHKWSSGTGSKNANFTSNDVRYFSISFSLIF